MAQKLGSGKPCSSTAHWQQTSQASASAPLLFGGAAQLCNEPPNAHICFSFTQACSTAHSHGKGGSPCLQSWSDSDIIQQTSHLFYMLSPMRATLTPFSSGWRQPPLGSTSASTAWQLTGQPITLYSLAAHRAARHPAQPGGRWPRQVGAGAASPLLQPDTMASVECGVAPLDPGQPQQPPPASAFAPPPGVEPGSKTATPTSWHSFHALHLNMQPKFAAIPEAKLRVQRACR